MRAAVMALRLEAQQQREKAQRSRETAEYHRVIMENALADALDSDNRAIDMEDAITKLEGDNL